MQLKYQIITSDCCKINERIAGEMGLDGIDTVHPFACDGTRLYGISEDNIHLLSDKEKDMLVEDTEVNIDIFLQDI